MSYGPRYKPKPQSLVKKKPPSAGEVRRVRNVGTMQKADERATQDINNRLKPKKK